MKFSIIWHEGFSAYKVSIPEYPGGEVCTIDELQAAEARAAELQFELDCIIRERDAAIAEVKRANAGFAALSKEYDKAMTRLAAHGEKVTA